MNAPNPKFYLEYTIDLGVPFLADQRNNRRLIASSPVYNGIEVRQGDFRTIDAGDDEEFIREMNARPGARATKLQLKAFEGERDFSVAFDDVPQNAFTPRRRMLKGDIFDFDATTTLAVRYDGARADTTVTGANTPYTTTGNGTWRIRCNPTMSAGETKHCVLNWNGVANSLWVYRDPTGATALSDSDVNVGNTIMFEPFIPPGGPSTEYINQTFSGVPANRLRRANPGTAIPTTGMLELIVNDQLITTFDVADLRAIRTYPNGRQYGALPGRYLQYSFEGVTHYLAWHNATTLFYGNSTGSGSWHVVLKDLSRPARNFFFDASIADRAKISWNRAGNDVVIYGLSPGTARLFINGNPIDNSDGIRRAYDIAVDAVVPAENIFDVSEIELPEQEIQADERITLNIRDWIKPVTASSTLPTVTHGPSGVVTSAVRRSYNSNPDISTAYLDITGIATTTAKTTNLTILDDGETKGITLSFRVVPVRPSSTTTVTEAAGLLDVSQLESGFVLLGNIDRYVDLTEYFWWDYRDDFPPDISDVTFRLSNDKADVVVATLSGTTMRLRTGTQTADVAGYATLTLMGTWTADSQSKTFSLPIPITTLDAKGDAPPRYSERSDERISPDLVADAFIPSGSLMDYPVGEDGVIAEQNGVVDSIRIDGGTVQISETPRSLTGVFKLQHINLLGPHYERSYLLEIADGAEVQDILLRFPVEIEERIPNA